jgi:hypothetical protein
MAVNILGNITKFVQGHLPLIIGIIVAFVVILWLVRRKPSALKPINRIDIERKNFIERNKMNRSSFKWLWRGEKLLGSIRFLRFTDLAHRDGDPQTPAIEIIYTPSLFGLKIPNPFARDICIMLNKETTEETYPNITIDDVATFDRFLGIYYDRKLAEEYIKVDSVFRTDLENLTSIYYAKAQEQCTIQPQFAHETLAKQQDIELEKQKRARIGG